MTATNAISRASSSIAQKASKWFHPRHHLWVQATKLDSSELQSSKDVVEKGLKDIYVYRVELGFTARGLEDIGDISDWKPAKKSYKKLDERRDDKYNNHNDSSSSSSSSSGVEEGETLVQLEWDGHAITSADELYHTVWETVTQTTEISSPVDGIVEHIPSKVPTENNKASLFFGTCLDEEVVLATLRITEAEWQNRTTDTTTTTTTTTAKNSSDNHNCLVNEIDYRNIVENLPPGRFAEDVA